MGIRLIISDVDETLICNDGKLMESEYAEELLSLIEEKKLLFTIASGRSYENILGATRGLRLPFPVIVGNGIAVVQNGEIKWSEQFPICSLRGLIEMADRMGMTVVMSDGISDRVYRMTEWASNRMKRSGHRYTEVIRKEDFWEKTFLGQVMIIDPEQESRISELLQFCEIPQDTLKVLRYGTHYLDIFPKGCSKGAALSYVADQLKVSLEECLAIGDNANDIEMIQKAGIGAAVANATAELKQRADYVCQKPAIEGVIECIKKFIY